MAERREQEEQRRREEEEQVGSKIRTINCFKISAQSSHGRR